jgi:hypothetical protein
MWTGRHKGERVIIGGFSPHIHKLPPSLLDTGAVIGFNQFADEFFCDYWMALDTGAAWQHFYQDDKPEYSHFPKFLRNLTVPKFMRRPNKDTEAFVPEDAAIFFEKAHHDEIPLTWNGRLRWASSTALAAINLAIIFGASEVVLFGVDFVGSGRADGSSYNQPNFWDPHKNGINNLIRWFSQHTKIYKTHPDSWLDCPLLEV